MKYSATLMSVIALLISIGSTSISLWSTFISQNSLKNTLKAQKRVDDEEFEKLRLAVLLQIADNMEIMKGYLIIVNGLKIKYDTEPQIVKELLKNNAVLFTDYLPRLDYSIKVLDSEWKNISSYSDESDYKKLMTEKANLYLALKQNEVIKTSVDFMINDFEKKLKLAEIDTSKSKNIMIDRK